jgi:putative aminopeptidase FrvX
VTLSLTDRIQQLAPTYGPFGREERVASLLTEWLAPLGYEISHDRLGTVYATRPGKAGGKTLLFAAHMDTLGAVVMNISEKGLLLISPIGDFAVHQAIGQRVVLSSGATGIIQHEPIDDVKELDWKKAFIDIGARSKEEALRKVKLGDIAVIDSPVYERGEGLITGAHLDNRASCALLAHVAANFAGGEHEVVFAFTAQGKVGPRGAAPAAWSVQPDAAVVLTLTNSADIPRGAKSEVKLGQGPALRLKDGGYVIRAELADQIRGRAEAVGVRLQIEVLPGGHSEAGLVANAGPGVPTALLAIPARYRGSATETIALSDLEETAKLLAGLMATGL